MKPEKQSEGEVKLTPELKFAIYEAVESRLLKLPAETYVLIEKMVEQRVSMVEKFYKRIAIVVSLAITLSAGIFYAVTAQNASRKASEAIVKSALGQKLKEIEQAHAQI